MGANPTDVMPLVGFAFLILCAQCQVKSQQVCSAQGSEGCSLAPPAPPQPSDIEDIQNEMNQIKSLLRTTLAHMTQLQQQLDHLTKRTICSEAHEESTFSSAAASDTTEQIIDTHTIEAVFPAEELQPEPVVVRLGEKLEELSAIKLPRQITALAQFSHEDWNGKFVFAGDIGGWIHIVQLPTKQFTSIQISLSLVPVTGLSVSLQPNDGPTMVTAQSDGTVSVWAVRYNSGKVALIEKSRFTLELGTATLRDVFVVKRPRRVLALLNTNIIRTVSFTGQFYDDSPTIPLIVKSVRKGSLVALATIEGPMVFEHSKQQLVACSGAPNIRADAIAFDPNHVALMYVCMSQALFVFRISSENARVSCSFEHKQDLPMAVEGDVDMWIHRDHIVLSDLTSTFLLNTTTNHQSVLIESISHSTALVSPITSTSMYPYVLLAGQDGEVSVIHMSIPKVTEMSWILMLVQNPIVAVIVAIVMALQLLQLCRLRNEARNRKRAMKEEGTDKTKEEKDEQPKKDDEGFRIPKRPPFAPRSNMQNLRRALY